MKQKLTKKEKEAYWKGFEDGKKQSLNHNILLMKSQLKAQEDFKSKKIRKIKWWGRT